MSEVRINIVDTAGNAATIVSTDTAQSLMELARANGIAGIEGDCGGGCACATCHVYVAHDWWDKVGEPDDIEYSMLDMVSDVQKPNSRLGCQIKLGAELDGLCVTVAPAFA